MDEYVTVEEFRELLTKRDLEFPIVPSEYEGVELPHSGIVEAIKDMKTFEVKDDDIWLVTYPKAGTTWTQEIVSCVMHDGDLEAVNKRHTMFRVPYIEQSLPAPIRQLKNIPTTIRIIDKMSSPRVIKSHLPGPLLPPQIWKKKPKIIYVLRNPKDVVVSFFFFQKMYNRQKAEQSFGEFFEDMLKGKVPYGTWWEHYLYFWKRRNDPNILLLRFEDMKRDLRGIVEKISQFLGKNLSAETLDAITEHCTFTNMKTNPMTNPQIIIPKQDKPTEHFMRKGKVGDWKSHFTVAQNEAMDALIRDKLHGTGLTFDC